MTVIPRVTIDMTGLNRGIALAMEYSKRTPAQVCNTAGLEVAFNAQAGMPSVAPATVDAELAVIETPIMGKRGKPLKGKKRFSGVATASGVPLTVLIIQARANPGSRYNLLTNSRYALPNSPFKTGKGGLSAGRAAMAMMEHQMVAARHKSGSFLKAGWSDVIKDLKPLSVNRYRRSTGMGFGKDNHTGSPLGKIEPAKDGQPNTQCVIENDIGYEGLNAANFNRALLLYGTAPLQSAIDNEGTKQMQYHLDRSGREELEIPVNAAWA